MSNVFAESEVFSYLSKNREHLKELVKDLTDQREKLLDKEDMVFHKDINDQYYGLVKGLIVEDLAKHIQCGADIIFSIVEALNLESYLKG